MRHRKMGTRAVERMKRILSMEIMIEYKACLYFCCIIFYYFACLLCQGVFVADILFMFEMIFTAYAAGYVQVCLFHNSDEAERLEKKDILGILFSTFLYGGTSWVLAWFDRSIAATGIFLVYMLLVHYCVYLLNRIKRAVDTQNLNRMLTEFKKEKPQGHREGKEDQVQEFQGGDEEKW